MKHITIVCIFWVCGALVADADYIAYQPEEVLSAESLIIMEFLESTIISEFKVEETRLSRVYVDITEAIWLAHDEKKGVSIIPQYDVRLSDDPLISISGESLKANVLLDAICVKGGHTWSLIKGVLVTRPTESQADGSMSSVSTR
ncbi:MAG: hypothetical protein MK080_13995 [Opitutales bacterium]|nr:hypothetical protein [Opitutales bacterium]NRA28579.1 hypothetical protein [Opitutales bacterium]